MRSIRLIFRSLRFYWRTHAGVVLAAAVTAAVLTGAFILGDCVRHSLRELAALRLGEVEYAIGGTDRFFRAKLADDLFSSAFVSSAGETAPVIAMTGAVKAGDSNLRAGGVQVLGVDERFWRLGGAPRGEIGEDEAVLNSHLAARLGVSAGQTVLLRVPRPAMLSRDLAISPTGDSTAAMPLTVHAVVSDGQFGRFSLRAEQAAPLTVFVSRRALAKRLKMIGRANLLLVGKGGGVTEALADKWRLDDAQLELRRLGDGQIELRTERVFLDESVTAAARRVGRGATGVLTYFVNELRHGERAAPYSMVSAVGPLDFAAGSARTAALADDEILINKWLADDLKASAGDSVTLSYYAVTERNKLVERTATFRVKGVIDMVDDRELMPQLPGLAEAENCGEWDKSLPIDLKKVRKTDEKYWEDYRGTPKAFVSPAAGRAMWKNRFGDLTAVRWPAGTDVRMLRRELIVNIDPAAMGLSVTPVGAMAIAAGEQSLDLGGYFLGLSFFLVASALMLTGLLFSLAMDQRSEQIGILLAEGFTPRRVRHLLLGEGVILAAVGAAVGAAGGTAYARAIIVGLSGVWRGVSAGSAITYYAQWSTLAIGAGGAFAAAIAAMWISLRSLARRGVSQLLAGGAGLGGAVAPAGKAMRLQWRMVMLLVVVVSVFVVTGFGVHSGGPPGPAFFAAGAILLAAGLWASRGLLGDIARAAGNHRPSLLAMAIRNCSRRPRRSMTVIALVACGVFLVISVGAFELAPSPDVNVRDSGTGGFALMGRSAIAVLHDINTPAGRDEFSLSESGMAGVSVVSMRVGVGDDASCLNLNRSQRPRLLGVDWKLLQQPGAFGQVKTGGDETADGWAVLGANNSDGSVNAIGDQPTIVYGLGKKLGDTIEYTDESGRPVKIRIAGIIQGSILQGSLLISDRDFVNLMPTSQGRRMFLIDAPADKIETVRRMFADAMSDVGMELESTATRLADLNTVQNTYLSIFQALGLLGMLLGVAGLGVVVVRGAMERRGELALLRAVGFSRGALVWTVFLEHWILLAMGLVCGTVAAMVAVAPVLAGGQRGAPLSAAAITFVLIALTGSVCTLGGASASLGGKLIDALRSE